MLELKYKDKVIFVVDGDGGVIDTFVAKRVDSVDVFGNFIFVTRNSGEQFLIDTVKDRYIEDFVEVRFLEKYNVIIVKYDEHDYRMLCSSGGEKSSCFEDFEVRKDGKMILHFHDRDIEFDPETGEEVSSRMVGVKELQERSFSWAGKKKPATKKRKTKREIVIL